MPTINTVANSEYAIVAELLAIIVNWPETESRIGRRGEFYTTGAQMVRVRELDEEELSRLTSMATALGLDYDEEELKKVFSGDFEYQVSFACNRFPSKSGKAAGGGMRLTANEMRAVERLRAISEKKPQAVAQALQGKIA